MEKEINLKEIPSDTTVVTDFVDGKGTFYKKIPISGNISIEDETGFMYCKNSILGNTGVQKYLGKEIGLKGEDAEKVIEMVRDDADVFNETSMASFEGKPITLFHPNTKINSKNFKKFIVGSIKDVKQDNDNLASNIVLYDEYTIGKVQKGELKDLSLGYRAKIIQMADGRYKQTDIVINHLAIVEEGRAINAQIIDNKTVEDDLEPKDFKDKIHVTKSKNTTVRVNTYDDETHEESTKEISTYENNHTHYEVAKQLLIDSNTKKEGEPEMEKKDFKYFMAELKDLATYPKGEFRDKAFEALSVDCKDTLGVDLPAITVAKESVIASSVGLKDSELELEKENEAKKAKPISIYAQDEQRYFEKIYRSMDNVDTARKYADMTFHDTYEAIVEGRTL